MIKAVFTSFLVFLISGCFEAQPTAYKYHRTITNSNSIEVTYNLIKEQSVKCYQEEAGFFTSGIMIKGRKNDRYAYVSYFVSHLNELETSPFVDITIEENAITIKEQPECIFGYCTPQNITNEVVKWVHGDLECKDQN